MPSLNQTGAFLQLTAKRQLAVGVGEALALARLGF
jgi:hypothetical protein